MHMCNDFTAIRWRWLGSSKRERGNQTIVMFVTRWFEDLQKSHDDGFERLLSASSDKALLKVSEYPWAMIDRKLCTSA